jgi:hypothetical protein
LHNDIRVLLRSQAGAFIFEHYQNTLLPAVANFLLEEIEKFSSDLIASLVAAWTHFYCHALPTVEAVFIQVKVRSRTVCFLPNSSQFIHHTTIRNTEGKDKVFQCSGGTAPRILIPCT